MSPNETRYLKEFSLSMAAYALAVLLAAQSLPRLEGLALRAAVSLLPVLPMVFALRAYLRYLADADELQQRIHLLAVAFAAGAVGMLTFALSFLENAGLPRFSLVWVFPALIGFWGLGIAWQSRRYR